MFQSRWGPWPRPKLDVKTVSLAMDAFPDATLDPNPRVRGQGFLTNPVWRDRSGVVNSERLGHFFENGSLTTRPMRRPSEFEGSAASEREMGHGWWDTGEFTLKGHHVGQVEHEKKKN